MRLLTIGLLLCAGTMTAAESRIDFGRDIRPIFNRHCISCHGGVKQAGGVSYVYRDLVLGKAKSGKRPVVPGDLGESELIHRITTKDLDDRMPPVEEQPSGLSGQEIETLKRWVLQGAPWSEHWAFVKPEAQPLPEVKNTAWCRNGIDRFILARLEKEEVTPAPDAAPDLWLRRASLDLIGLPPTPEERTAFLSEVERVGEPAYAAAADRLLALPQFGERWASVWLDQVRYADSKGLGQDGRRNIWKYRDWVINAFNRDLPYDQFTIEQIAGDLLPNPTMEDRIATAAHRLTQSNEEGGTDDEEFRVAAVLDRVNTTWQAWQGLTFGCVQCHNHPYDPIRHDEYYRFAAFFNNTADCDLDEEWPVALAPLNSDDDPEAARLDREIRASEENLWRKEAAPLRESAHWQPLTGLSAESSTATKVVVESVDGHDEFHTVDTVTRNTDFTLQAPLPSGLETLTAIRVTAKPLDPKTALPDSEWGFVLSHVQAELVVPGQETNTPVPFARVVGDEPHPFFDPQESLNAKSNRGFAAYSRINYPRQAAFILQAPLKIPAGAQLRVKLQHRVMLLGAFSLVTRRGELAVSGDDAFTDLLNDPQRAEWQSKLKQLRHERAEIKSTTVPVLEDRPNWLARPTHVFIRGLFLTKGDEVSPNVPAIFPSLPAGPTNRLALARWLVSPENPLTARVAVNRFWARLFGTGIVATEEDFGSSGEPPSHPALLDYLALRFENADGWSVKTILREMVLSSAYRQSDRIRPELLDRDPQNRWLARGPRTRLPAEIVRDQALAIGGLLSKKQFGPPVHPPIPEGVWHPFQGGDKWDTPAPGHEERYRRSIYTYIKRSIPYPMFAAFDAPSREFCTPRRLRSNTPLQALMTLNDETFAECAQGLARRMKYQTDGCLEDKLKAGYLVAAGHEAAAGRIEELKALYQKMEKHYAANPAELKGLAGTPDGAAFTVVAGVLLNLDEVLTK